MHRQGVALEPTQAIAAHESPWTTKRYDPSDEIDR